MELRILPGNIANMIAAGEVVQRPASVVKELMENALDAGATQITVSVVDAGRTLIQVIDNGCGMTPDAAVLSFERHATSKIATAEDLDAISTFGFRGEALASIAAVAEVTLRTRRAEDEIGCQVCMAASEHVSTEEVSCPCGSNFAVRNLFYNVPARRKFLKSDNVELKHVIETFTKIAMTRPDIGFTLTSDRKDIFVLKPAKTLKIRIHELLGASVVGEVVDIAAETSVAGVSGFVGTPAAARKTQGNEFFFVNGRYFRSPYFHKAVMKAYENLIPEGTNPSYVIFLEVDPHSIDVNISPTKTEVKFEEDAVIFQILYACIKETIGKNAFSASIDFDLASEQDLPVIGRKFEEYSNASTPMPDFNPDYNPFDSASEFGSTSESGSGLGIDSGFGVGSGSGVGSGAESASAPGYEPRPAVDRRQDYGKLFEDNVRAASNVLVVQGKYIITPARSGMMMVNVRRACERILFERFLDAMSCNGHVSQRSLFPVSVQIGPAGKVLFDDNADLLAKLGFDIVPFGNDTVVVNGVPEGCAGDETSVRTMIGDIMSVLSDGTTGVAEAVESSMAEKMAMLASMSSAPVSSPAEAQKLIDTLFACSNPELTSNGRKVISIVTIDEMDKKF